MLSIAIIGTGTIFAEKGWYIVWENVKKRALEDALTADASRIQLNIDGKGTLKLDETVTKEDLIRSIVRYDKKLHERDVTLKTIADIAKTEL
jgi:hypothetical protein